jgi:hypothetical protein
MEIVTDVVGTVIGQANVMHEYKTKQYCST